MLHTLHGVIVATGVVFVGYLVLPSGRARQIKTLREAASHGALTDVASLRAAELLRSAGAAPKPADRALIIAAAASVLAACVHAGVGPEHFAEGLRFGVFFIVLSLAQLASVPLLVRWPSPSVLSVTAGLSLGRSAFAAAATGRRPVSEQGA